MKLRLRIETQSGESWAFEHDGPTIHVGRDPDCELTFGSGEGTDKISRRHVRIHLSPKEATVTDLGSSNKTLVNGEAIEADVPVLLHEGDCIQLGRTGVTTLTVTE